MLLKLNKVLALFSNERPELSAREIATRFHWPKSTAYRLLHGIEAAGFLDRDPQSGLYRLGMRLAVLGELARNSTTLQRIADPVLRRLSAETCETATVMLLDGAAGVTVQVVESYQPLMIPGLLGGRAPLHASAGGKAFLAWSSPARQRALIRPPLQRFTPATITDVRVLMRELEQSQARGYAMVDGEHHDHVVAVGAPVYNHRGEVAAALTVGGPRFRAGAKVHAIGHAVAAAARSVSAGLGYPATGVARSATSPRPTPTRRGL